MCEKTFLTAVHPANLLQAHDVGIELLDRVTQIVNFKTPGWAYALNTFVDVVSGHTQNGVFVSLGHDQPMACENRGSIKMASALEGEKHRSAAACQGCHCQSVCSAGLSVMGILWGTRSPNTRSVLRLTSGAYFHRQAG
jgi:hypothetical protein